MKKLKIPFALGAAFIITLFLSHTLFLFNSPRTNRFFILSFLKKITSLGISQQSKQRDTLNIPTITIPVRPFQIGISPLPTPKPISTSFNKFQPVSTISPTPKPTTCPKTSSQNYQTVQTNSDYTLNSPAETHPEINLALRGYTAVKEQASTVHYGGDTDPQALKINSIFTDGRKPTVAKTYKVHAWDYANNKSSNDTENAWPVSLIGLSSTPGESIIVPPSGRNISGDLELMVLYADENRVTFTNSVGDNWTDGYILHVEDICTDPNLIAAYQNANSSGRGSLPALPKGQVFGTAKNSEVKVAIRDSGQFMDPRSDKDWW